MVSLDNLKTALSAIKSDINSIASRYLKKTDADSIYITKKSANNSFATKSSVPKISSFEDPHTLKAIRSLKFPSKNYSYAPLGSIEYTGDTYDTSELSFKGKDYIRYDFDLDLMDGGVVRDYVNIVGGGLSDLKSGQSITDKFAKSEDSLARAKKVALSSTGKEFSTPREFQGVMYYTVQVDTYTFRLTSSNVGYLAVGAPARLHGLLSSEYDGHLYYFISDEITESTPVGIPFTVTRLDGATPNPYGLTISVHGVDSVAEVEYTGASSKNIDIYSDLYEVKLTGPNGAGLYSSSLNFATIYEAYNNKRLLYIPYLDYRLRLVNIDPSGAYNFCYATFAEIIRKTEFGIDILVAEMSCSDEYSKLSGPVKKYTVPTLSETGSGIILKSSTPGSEKFLSITVDDSGAIKATEV